MKHGSLIDPTVDLAEEPLLLGRHNAWILPRPATPAAARAGAAAGPLDIE